MAQDRTQWLADVEEIKQLKARYYRFNDTQDWNAFQTVFTPDVYYDTGTRILTGAARVASVFGSGMEGGGKTAHIAGMPEITITGPDTATGVWAFRDYVQLAGDRGGPIGFHGYGHEHDEYVRTPDGWKIKKVVITRVRVDALQGGLPDAFHNPYAEGRPTAALQ